MRLPVLSPIIRASSCAAASRSKNTASITVLRTTSTITTAAAAAATTTTQTLRYPKSRAQQQQQVRWNWQIVLQPVRDPETGQMKYPDWDIVTRTVGFPEPTKHQTSLLNRHLQQEEHVKPTELNRRINSRKVYQRSMKRVEDLKTYIKFIQDNRTE